MAFSLANVNPADLAIVLGSEWIPRKEEELSEDILACIGEPDPVITKDLPTAEEVLKARWDLRTFGDLAEMVPEDQDPSILFRNNWLALGQSFMLVASSGVGKSSMSVQMAFFWSLGIVFLATPMRPLRICIIQGEDSDRDLQEQRDGMRRGLSEQFGWSEERIADAASKIVITPDFVGFAGDKFIERLREFQRDNRFDLIIINPVQSFFGGDVNAQEDVSHFVREGLDPIMKDKEAPCCIGLVAHTPKQKSGQKDGRQNVNDYGEYLMAGSHEWTDWARAVLCFLKSERYEGVYEFAAPKRGLRLGWKKEDGSKTVKRYFSHSDGYIFWKDVTAQVELGTYSADDDSEDAGDDMLNAYVCALADYIKKGDGAVCRSFLKDKYTMFGRTRKMCDDVFMALYDRAGRFGLVAREFLAARCKKYVPYIGTEAQIKRLATQMKMQDDYAEMMGVGGEEDE